jgi:Tfp pilus assembly protein PilF
MQVFEYNAARNGDAWPVHVGLARGYAAKGDTKQALEHARKALPQAPDEQNRKILEAMIDALAKGAPIQ